MNMKKLIAGVIIMGSMLAVPLSAQAAVKKIWKPTKIVSYVKEKGKWRKEDTITLKYNSKGLIASKTYKEIDVKHITKFTYTGTKLKRIDNVTDNAYQTITINKKGQITKIKIYDKSMDTVMTVKYTYSSNGRAMHREVNNSPSVLDCDVKIDSKGRVVSSKQGFGWSFKYSSFDSHGNPKKEFYSGEYKLTTKHSYKYDKKGRLKEKVSKTSEGRTTKVVYSGYKKVNATSVFYDLITLEGY